MPLTESLRQQPTPPDVTVPGVDNPILHSLNRVDPEQLRMDVALAVADTEVESIPDSALPHIRAFMCAAEQIVADQTQSPVARAALGVWAARLAAQAGAVIEEK